MKTDTALVADYLDAVGRESTALHPGARQELLADLREHIEAALAERPGDVHAILRETGDPRTIAATALQEFGTAPAGSTPAPEPGRPRRPRSPAWLPIAFLLTNGIAGMFTLSGISPVLLLLLEAVQITAVVIVWRSRHWTTGQKWTGLALALFLPVVLRLVWNLGVPEGVDGREVWRWVLICVALALNVSGCVWLWRTKRP
ncbi:hypothetical protein ACFVS9_04940 [Streptomyces sp. NPDC058008]|uniref:HAAS signaling domain-containing protein n=1 Tax=Streptomyces sp. NPDC058008 TaxID=3346303 RepID=UPI0036E79D1D